MRAEVIHKTLTGYLRGIRKGANEYDERGILIPFYHVVIITQAYVITPEAKKSRSDERHRYNRELHINIMIFELNNSLLIISCQLF